MWEQLEVSASQEFGEDDETGLARLFVVRTIWRQLSENPVDPDGTRSGRQACNQA